GRLRRPAGPRRMARQPSAADHRRFIARPRHRLGGASRRRHSAGDRAAETALPARARRPAAGRRAPAAPLIGFLRMLGRPEPVLSEAGPRDAGALAALHAAAFRRGWSEDEVERLLLDKAVIAHRAMIGRTLAGFIISRLAGGEAEILSVA